MLYTVLHTFTTATRRFYKYDSILPHEISETDLAIAIAKRWVRKVL